MRFTKKKNQKKNHRDLLISPCRIITIVIFQRRRRYRVFR